MIVIFALNFGLVTKKKEVCRITLRYDEVLGLLVIFRNRDGSWGKVYRVKPSSKVGQEHNKVVYIPGEVIGTIERSGRVLVNKKKLTDTEKYKFLKDFLVGVSREIVCDVASMSQKEKIVHIIKEYVDMKRHGKSEEDERKIGKIKDLVGSFGEMIEEKDIKNFRVQAYQRNDLMFDLAGNDGKKREYAIRLMYDDVLGLIVVFKSQKNNYAVMFTVDKYAKYDMYSLKVKKISASRMGAIFESGEIVVGTHFKDGEKWHRTQKILNDFSENMKRRMPKFEKLKHIIRKYADALKGDGQVPSDVKR